MKYQGSLQSALLCRIPSMSCCTVSATASMVGKPRKTRGWKWTFSRFYLLFFPFPEKYWVELAFSRVQKIFGKIRSVPGDSRKIFLLVPSFFGSQAPQKKMTLRCPEFSLQFVARRKFSSLQPGTTMCNSSFRSFIYTAGVWILAGPHRLIVTLGKLQRVSIVHVFLFTITMWNLIVHTLW